MPDGLDDLTSIETQRLLLVRVRTGDADDMVAMHQDERFVEAFGVRSTEDEVRAFTAQHVEHWDRLGWGLWTLRDRATGEFVGRGGIRPVTIEGADEVELGYAFRPEWWGRGLAVEMSRVALDVGFDRIGLETIVAFTMPTNTRSRRVMEKLGFGYERDLVWANIPHVLYRLRREGWQAARSDR